MCACQCALRNVSRIKLFARYFIGILRLERYFRNSKTNWLQFDSKSIIYRINIQYNRHLLIRNMTIDIKRNDYIISLLRNLLNTIEFIGILFLNEIPSTHRL